MGVRKRNNSVLNRSRGSDDNNPVIDMKLALDTYIKEHTVPYSDTTYLKAIGYINRVKDIQPIYSSQVGAVVLANAVAILKGGY